MPFNLKVLQIFFNCYRKNSQRKRKFKSCHQEEQEKPTIKEDEINPTIRKITKKWEDQDQPCQQKEFSGQPYN